VKIVSQKFCEPLKELQNEIPKVLSKIILTLEKFILNFFQVLFVLAAYKSWVVGRMEEL
jgi:hypothetical protein